VDVPGPPSEPDPRLVAAAALVFVDDLNEPRIDTTDLHHLLDVRRLGPDDPVVAADGAGSWVACRLVPGADGPGRSSRRRSAALVVDGPVERQERPAPRVTVAFAPVKGDRPEWVTQKLTEVGVDRIVLVRAARTVVRWEGERAGRALDRLRRVAREAAAQCRRLWLPEVDGPIDLDRLEPRFGPMALARPGGAPPSLDPPAIVVGPEGGWDEAEVARFPCSVGLGPSVLRAETAALVAGALLCGLRARLVEPLA
jgi:16S rRNA (uracil1498-N3)-methyltransferase